jgi:hypothetical protein
MPVRKAQISDLEVISELCDQFWLTHQPEVPYDKEYFISFLRAGMNDPTCLALLLDDDQGLFLAVITKSIFAPTKIAKEIVWFTRPDARGRGMELFRAFSAWASMLGADHLHCSLQRPSVAMRRLGFFPVETGYIRPVDNVNQCTAVHSF